MLNELETEYGLRNRSFTVLGMEFIHGAPRIWFPGNRNYIVIQLSADAMIDRTKALFQVAHECVHLLDPVVFGEASVLEEGLATNVSLRCIHRISPQYLTGDPKYDAANQHVTALLAKYPKVIRQLRKKYGLSGFEPKRLRGYCRGLPSSERELLAMPFTAWSGS